ncbi:unnamed protein product [Ectocarpus sp. 6 AP-2014]
MAMRRPKKLTRPTGSSSASRLGPGMKTMDLRFSPAEGWGLAGVSSGSRGTTGPAAPPPRWVISWEVGPGATVDRGLKLAKLHCVGVDKDGGPGDTKEQFIVAPREGILTELLVPTGGQVSPGQGCPDQDAPAADSASSKTPAAAAVAAAIRTDDGAEPQASGEGVVVGRISFCAHQELHGTLCTSCGRVVLPQSENGRGRGQGDAAAGGGGERREEGGGDTHQVLMKGGKIMSVTAEGRRMMHMNKSGRLLNSKKLSLVLDLDNTLLHCSDHPEAGRVVVPGVDGIHALRLPNQQREYYIKLRPGLRRFLAQAATMFEMTIYTAGTSQYADAVASVLDPDRSLFQGRHFSTCYTPDLGRNTKSLERIFPNGLDMALIVDDRDDVWRGEQAKNLLLVRPYKFFVGQRSVPGGPTHDAGPHPQPPPKPAAAPAPFRERLERSAENSPLPGATKSGRPGVGEDGDGSKKGEGKEEEEEAEEEELGDRDKGAMTTGQARKPSRGKEEEEDNGKKCVVKVRHDGAGGGRTSHAERGEDEDSDVEMNGVEVGRQQGEQQQLEEEEEAGQGVGPHDSGSGRGGKEKSPSSSCSSSSDKQVASLGEGLARMLENKRQEQEAGGSSSSRGAEEAEGGHAGGNRPSVPGTKKPTVAGDSTLDEDGKEKEKEEDAADAVGVGSPETGAGDRAAAAATPGDSGKPAVAPAAAGAAAAGDGGGNGGDGGSGSLVRTSSSSSSNSSSGEGHPPGRRREMLAPPMSPPKVVASAENDPQLDCTFKTLEAVHGAFYAPENSNHGQPRAAAGFLAKVRLRVLTGVRMVFSGVIPVSGAPADPRTHRLWMMAESHGATVERDIGRHTTHVVAVRLGTAKTKTGLRMPGVFVVHLDWLMNSVWHCRRERETMFLLAGQICGGDPPPLPAPLPPPESSMSSADVNRRGSILSARRGRSSERGTASSSGSGSESGDGGGGGGGDPSPRDPGIFRRKRQREGEDEDEDEVDDRRGDEAFRSRGRSGSGGGGVWGRGPGRPESRGSVGRRSGSMGSSIGRASSVSSGSADDGSSVGSDLDGLVDELENSS